MSGAGGLVATWREEAAILRRWGATEQAAVLERAADELEEREAEHALEALTLHQAAQESHYTVSALEKMLRRGQLENVGKKGAPRIRRGDLPRKATRGTRPDESGDDLATVTLRNRLGAGR